VQIQLSKLKHHPLNSLIYTSSSIDQLIVSIKSVGLLEPLVINKKNQIISGNRRFQALKSLGLDEVEVIKKDIKKEEEPLYLIHYNKQRVKKASEILNEIKTLREYYGNHQGQRTDLDETFSTNGKSGSLNSSELISEEVGMKKSNLYKLLYIDKEWPETIKLIDDGKITISQAYVEAKRRVVFKNISKKKSQSSNGIPNHSDLFTIYNKSSTSMDELEDQSVQMIMTSPPYFRQRNYGVENQIGLEKDLDDYLDNLMEVFDECYRVLSDKGSLFIVIGDKYIDGHLQSVPHKVAIRMMENHWIQRNCIVWRKTNPKPEAVQNRFTTCTEFIFFFTKHKSDYYFDIDSIRDPYKGGELSDVRSPRHHSIKGDFKVNTPVFQNPNGKVPKDFFDTDIIETSKVSTGIGKDIGLDDIEHGAVYPTELCEKPILSTTKEGDLVLDPFCGSGTTGKVALKYGRKFVGYEINPNYVELSEMRLNRSCIS
jgi:DNA modification methylase